MVPDRIELSTPRRKRGVLPLDYGTDIQFKHIQFLKFVITKIIRCYYELPKINFKIISHARNAFFKGKLKIKRAEN